MWKEQRPNFSCFFIAFSPCIFFRSCYNRTCNRTEQQNNQSICPRSVVDSTRDSGSLSVGSNPAEGATCIRPVRIGIPKLLDTTAFAVVFHFLGIPKKTIESEKILYEFCTTILHGRAPPSRGRPAGILFVPSRPKCANMFVGWSQYLYAPGRRVPSRILCNVR